MYYVQAEYDICIKKPIFIFNKPIGNKKVVKLSGKLSELGCFLRKCDPKNLLLLMLKILNSMKKPVVKF